MKLNGHAAADQFKVSVQSSDVDLGEAFRNHARQCIHKNATKYFGHLSMASVHVHHEGVAFTCSVNMQMGRLKVMSAECTKHDLYQAFNIAMERVATQLRRYKREQREDKAVRVDKTAVLEDGARVDPKAIQDDGMIRTPLPDDYDRAVTQAAKQAKA